MSQAADVCRARPSQGVVQLAPAASPLVLFWPRACLSRRAEANQGCPAWSRGTTAHDQCTSRPQRAPMCTGKGPPALLPRRSRQSGAAHPGGRGAGPPPGRPLHPPRVGHAPFSAVLATKRLRLAVTSPCAMAGATAHSARASTLHQPDSRALACSYHSVCLLVVPTARQRGARRQLSPPAALCIALGAAGVGRRAVSSSARAGPRRPLRYARAGRYARACSREAAAGALPLRVATRSERQSLGCVCVCVCRMFFASRCAPTSSRYRAATAARALPACRPASDRPTDRPTDRPRVRCACCACACAAVCVACARACTQPEGGSLCRGVRGVRARRAGASARSLTGATTS